MTAAATTPGLLQIYAQGMSVAAMSAMALDEALVAALASAGSTGGGGSASLEAQQAAIRGMGPAFQKRLAAVVDTPWSIASSEDSRQGAGGPCCDMLCAMLCRAPCHLAPLMAQYCKHAWSSRAPPSMQIPRH